MTFDLLCLKWWVTLTDQLCKVTGATVAWTVVWGQVCMFRNADCQGPNVKNLGSDCNLLALPMAQCSSLTGLSVVFLRLLAVVALAHPVPVAATCQTWQWAQHTTTPHMAWASRASQYHHLETHTRRLVSSWGLPARATPAGGHPLGTSHQTHSRTTVQDPPPSHPVTMRGPIPRDHACRVTGGLRVSAACCHITSRPTDMGRGEVCGSDRPPGPVLCWLAVCVVSNHHHHHHHHWIITVIITRKQNKGAAPGVKDENACSKCVHLPLAILWATSVLHRPSFSVWGCCNGSSPYYHTQCCSYDEFECWIFLPCFLL